MKWHDGKPVTVEDVIFSFEAPSRRQVADVQAVRRPTSPRSRRPASDGLRFKLKQPNAAFLTAYARQDQPDPQARLGADPEGPGGQAGERRADPGAAAKSARARSRLVRCKPQRGDRARAHDEPLGGAEDGALDHAHRAQRRGERSACCSAASSTSWRTTAAIPRCSTEFAKEKPDIQIRSEIDIGLRVRRPSTTAAPPFDDLAFRRALSLAIDRRADGPGGLERLCRAGQPPCLAGAAVLARRRDVRQDRRRRSQGDPAGGRIPKSSAASSTTRSARRKR